MDPGYIRGLIAVPDLQGHLLRLFSVRVARPEAPVASPVPVPAPAGRQGLWFTLAAIIVGVNGVAGAIVVILRRRRRTNDQALAAGPPIDAAVPDPTDPPTTTARISGPARQPLRSPQVAPPAGPVAPATPADIAVVGRKQLRALLAATNSVFRYQPQIDLQTGRVAGVEALLCMGESSENRPAIELIAELEAARLGIALAERWLQEACTERRFWLRQIGHDFPVSVPVPQHTFEDPAFLPLVRRILAEYELAPRFLELEVSESALAVSVATRRALGGAHEIGVCVAIDGFRATQSILRLLTLQPIAKLRIDSALVREVRPGGSQRVLFDGIVGAARGLGIVACATGVDSPELVAAAERHGRPLAQGTALSPPVDSEQFLAFVRNGADDTVRLPPLELDDARSEPEAPADEDRELARTGLHIGFRTGD
jgi:EAL domain-containing protein (putative c-di-GMP-specific phosphodiesterase class I)